ncbi:MULTISPECIES: IclR family transcriptional regulator [Kocuria]|uniref:IclR family transcriptional regulator n=1 Tax=Kocuria subflava TaxID=1736139 RepID=A0A846TUU9_9MICC|nr:MULTISPECIES: IclR family transcriptional regulator [Kocuria]NKE09514.1 IclR family transcriptional regulator [Kocuria subflava]
MANSRSGETVIERVDKILAVFTAHRPRLTAAEVADSSGLPSSTAHRLCGELAQRGWLERDGGAYVVGTRLWELSTRSAQESSLAAVATPFMQDAHAVLGQHIQLGRRQGREVLILQRLSARGARSISSGVAGRLPLHVSAVGLILLAWMDPQAREGYLRDLHAAQESIPQGTVTQLERILAAIRSVGHTVQTGNVEPDRTAIAVPVRNHRGDVVAGLGAVLDRAEVSVDAEVTVQVLRAAAHGVERTLKRNGRPV